MTNDEREIREIEGSIDHIRGQLSGMRRRRGPLGAGSRQNDAEVRQIREAGRALNALQDAVAPLQAFRRSDE